MNKKTSKKNKDTKPNQLSEDSCRCVCYAMDAFDEWYLCQIWDNGYASSEVADAIQESLEVFRWHLHKLCGCNRGKQSNKFIENELKRPIWVSCPNHTDKYDCDGDDCKNKITKERVLIVPNALTKE